MFCAVEDVSALLMLEINDTDEISACLRAIDEVTEAIKNYCHQVIEQVEDDEITIDGHGGTRIFLPELPVTEVSAVEEDGDLLTENTDYKLGENGVLHRLNGYWKAGVQNYVITYTHGLATIPDDLMGVCVRAASRIYQAGLRAKSQNGIVGIANMALGDYQVGYASEAGGGISEGLMGVSAARMLLLSEKDILNRYRYKRL